MHENRNFGLVKGFHVAKAIIGFSLLAIGVGGCASTTQVDVAIVGAGVSGITAYLELKKKDPNIKVAILEAANEIGGRLKSVQFGGATVERGASFLQNPYSAVSKLQKKMGIRRMPITYLNISVFDVNGDKIQDNFNAGIQRIISKNSPLYKTSRIAYRFWEELDDSYSGSESIRKVMVQNGYNFTSEKPLDAFIRWMKVDWEFTTSNVALLNYYDIEKDVYSINATHLYVTDQRGHSYFPKKLAVDNKIKVNFRTKVNKIIYDNHSSIDKKYKVIVESTDTVSGQKCSNIKARRVIVTVPVGVLHGKGYGIKFSPAIKINRLPMDMGQFTKFFVKFTTKFWGNKQFVGILRSKNFQGVCSHWQNMDYFIPGSKILMCTMTDEGMKKFISKKLTTSDLLDPLRTVYGTKVVNSAVVDTYLSRWDREPTTGYGAYSYFRPGYTIDDYYKFFGGAPADYELGKGEGVNKAGQWVVHLGGTASCLNHYELVDGAYHSGQRSAGFVLRSLGYKNVTVGRACDY